jgi:hypothetical protein
MMMLVNAEHKAFVEPLTDSLYQFLLVEAIFLPSTNWLEMEQKMKGSLLNPSQKNSLRVTLRLFEENLRQAQTWLEGYEENGILYQRKLTLSEENREQAWQEVNAALELIEKLSHRFSLRKETSNAASMLRGVLTIDWANLYDTRAGKLKRFGKVQPEIASLLDADIQNLAGIALHLSAILAESQQEKP